jgi:two-component system chemotaxis response regulator CheB
MASEKRVLIVDDSPLMLRLLSEIVGNAPGFEVAGTAEDAAAAREMLRRDRPDVVTLDIKMPDIDGLTFLREIMSTHPTPVVMVSYFTREGAEATLNALELGAVDYVGKPLGSSGAGVAAFKKTLLERLGAASGAKLVRHQRPRNTVQPASDLGNIGRSVIAIGSSTGGTEALREILQCLPARLPGIVIVQHMPEYFTPTFAKSLDNISEMKVREARDGDEVSPGVALLARGDHHMVLRREGGGYRIATHQAPKVWGCRPSVDILFESVAEAARQNAIGVILTGMGEDGAIGLSRMKKNGARTIAQDEKSYVVFGMPKKAIDLKAVDHVHHLYEIPQKIMDLLADRARA